jgi:hypothetical protein
MPAAKSVASVRVRKALDEVRALVHAMDDFARSEGLGALDELPDGAALSMQDPASETLSERELKERARDLLALARFAANTALHSMTRSRHGDAADAFPNVLKAAYTYGIVQSVVIAWNGGVGKLVDQALLARRDEAQRLQALAQSSRSRSAQRRRRVQALFQETDRLLADEDRSATAIVKLLIASGRFGKKTIIGEDLKGHAAFQSRRSSRTC